MEAEAPSGDQPTRTILTLGGCNVLEVGKRLGPDFRHTHIWSVNLHSLGSPPFELERQPTGIFQSHLGAFIERETRKTYLKAIAAKHFDVVLISAQTTHYRFGLKGDVCIPDFTDKFFIPDTMLQGAPRPSIADFMGAGTKVIGWADPEYLERAMVGVDRAYEDLLLPWIRGGTRVFFYDQELLETELRADSIHPLARAIDVPERNALNKKIIDYAATKPGVGRLSTARDFGFTSADAPWSPLEDVHPIEEQYVHLAVDLARQIGNGLGDEIWRHHALEMRRRSLGKDDEWRTKLHAESQRRHAVGEANQALSLRTQQLAERVRLLESELKATRRSFSWRVTAPLRAVRRTLAPYRRPGAR